MTWSLWSRIDVDEGDLSLQGFLDHFQAQPTPATPPPPTAADAPRPRLPALPAPCVSRR